MTASAEPPPLILMATGRDRAGMRGYDSERYRVLTVPSGTILCRWVRDLRPDVVMLDAELDDMTGPEAYRALCAAFQVGQEVPILMLTNGTPTPAERIAALRAGAWDCFEAPHSADQLALQCETDLAAKRGLDSVLGGGLFDPATGLYTRTGLARRTRELGALMARTHSALACLVFAPDHPVAPRAARRERISRRSLRGRHSGRGGDRRDPGPLRRADDAGTPRAGAGTVRGAEG